MEARNTQGVLNHWAQGFLERHGAIREETGTYYSDVLVKEYPLCKYTFPDGRVYYEAVQDTAWSRTVKGIAFLVLKNERGKLVPSSLWSREEMETYP